MARAKRQSFKEVLLGRVKIPNDVKVLDPTKYANKIKIDIKEKMKSHRANLF
jgi:hypothetical protein